MATYARAQEVAYLLARTYHTLIPAAEDGCDAKCESPGSVDFRNERNRCAAVFRRASETLAARGGHSVAKAVQDADGNRVTLADFPHHVRNIISFLAGYTTGDESMHTATSLGEISGLSAGLLDYMQTHA